MAQMISEQEVRHVARLSRLRLTEEQVRHYAEQLSAILGYVSKLRELNVEGVEPMAHALDMSNVLRADQETPGLPPEVILRNAPDHDASFCTVPKVRGDEAGA